MYGKSEGAVPINSDDMTAEWTVTWPSFPQRCSTSDGEEFSEKEKKDANELNSIIEKKKQ